MSAITSPTGAKDRDDVFVAESSPCYDSSFERHAPKRRTTIPLDRHAFLMQSSAIGLSTLHSPAVHRVQMREAFVKIYFPVADQTAEEDFMYSGLLGRDVIQGGGNAVIAAIDTLILLQVGMAFKESPMIKEARNRYSVARGGLRRSLLQTEFSWSDEAIAIMYILGFCDIPSMCGGNWPKRSHHDMLEEMLQTWGPPTEVSETARRFVKNFRYMAAVFGCSRRKKVILDGKDWRAYSTPANELMRPLSEFIMEGPLIIETADLAAQGRVSDTSKVLLELAELENKCKLWLLTWYRSLEGPPYWLDDLNNFPNLANRFDHGVAAFPKAFRFPSFSVASAHASYWITLLMVKSATLEILHGRESLFSDETRQSIVVETTECANNLCQSIGWLTQPEYGLCGINRAIGPLRHAAEWYAKQNQKEKAEWCEAVRRGFERCSAIASLFHNLPKWRTKSFDGSWGIHDF